VLIFARSPEFADFAEAFKKGRAAGCAIAASVIFDTISKSKQESLKLGAAQFYLARRGEWHEQATGASVEVNLNGVPVGVDDQAQERDRQLEMIRLLTADERRLYLDLMDRAARRQRGEEIVVDTTSTLLLEDGFEVVEDDDEALNGLDATGNGKPKL
jgi:hypothetical protein